MLLTVSTTHRPATDLGFLLHKHPDRAQSVEVAGGTAHVFYPDADEDLCTAALLLEVDPVGLVRGRHRNTPEDFALGRYVNDRPYAASSLLAAALKRVFGTALTGRCDARPELAAGPLPLTVRVPVLPCRGGPELASRLFAPLGWQVAARVAPLDPEFPDWGDSPYVEATLTGQLRLADALTHLYVLLPVLDDAKHYWVGTDEVDKLVRSGGGWLAAHPERELISARYLRHRRTLADAALARLAELDGTDPDELDDDPGQPAELDAAPAPPLVALRHEAVLAAVREAGGGRVGDLGCGSGALVGALLAEPSVTSVLASDVSVRALQIAARRLGVDRMSPAQRGRLELVQSALTYTDARLAGLDVAVLMEVLEHVDPDRLPAVEHAVFAAAAPRAVVVTTPNAEYNARFPALAAGGFRHRDHRFEWTRAEFADWLARVCAAHGYRARTAAVGPEDPRVGPPTQLAVLTRGPVPGTGPAGAAS